MENNEKSSIFPLIVIFVVIVALIGGAYWFGKSSIMKSPQDEISDVRESTAQESTAQVEEQTTVGEPDTEESGSVPEENITEEDVEEESDASVIETLKLLFAQKYERRVEDVNVTISQREGDYLTGGVKFAGELAGGYVLAAKVNGAWKIVFDGNGNYTCAAVDIVDFPSDLAPECWDENTMKAVDRTVK